MFANCLLFPVGHDERAKRTLLKNFCPVMRNVALGLPLVCGFQPIYLELSSPMMLQTLPTYGLSCALYENPLFHISLILHVPCCLFCSVRTKMRATRLFESSWRGPLRFSRAFRSSRRWVFSSSGKPSRPAVLPISTLDYLSTHGLLSFQISRWEHVACWINGHCLKHFTCTWSSVNFALSQAGM